MGSIERKVATRASAQSHKCSLLPSNLPDTVVHIFNMSAVPLLSLAHKAQARVVEFREGGKIALAGNDLDIAAVVAIARSVRAGTLEQDCANMGWRHDCLPVIEDTAVLARLADSVRIVEEKSLRQTALYGKN